jgi:hypothetical protein
VLEAGFWNSDRIGGDTSIDMLKREKRILRAGWMAWINRWITDQSGVLHVHLHLHSFLGAGSELEGRRLRGWKV